MIYKNLLKTPFRPIVKILGKRITVQEAGVKVTGYLYKGCIYITSFKLSGKTYDKELHRRNSKSSVAVDNPPLQ